MLTGEIILAIGLVFGASVFNSVFDSVVDGVVVCGKLCTVGGVATVTGADWVGVTDVLKVGFAGLTGETGLVTLVGFDKDLTQVFDEVTHDPLHTG